MMAHTGNFNAGRSKVASAVAVIEGTDNSGILLPVGGFVHKLLVPVLSDDGLDGLGGGRISLGTSSVSQLRGEFGSHNHSTLEVESVPEEIGGSDKTLIY
jgi:hypothetical protein